MDSPTTETIGSGQALLYVNLGLGAQPPDSDNDGFFDPCDNCVNVPNGPFLGTCVTESGSTVGGPCLSDQQCSGGQFCSMAQEDNDFDPPRDSSACPSRARRRCSRRASLAWSRSSGAAGGALTASY